LLRRCRRRRCPSRSWTSVMARRGMNTSAITCLTIHGARCSQVATKGHGSDGEFAR
jgi:hypothetical protein